ncbi:hypothetical protein CDAR_539451 [Caerostris darwini]|uniref:Uncharacterized protein n=1 Tax=Caerostris darwini TaxID=1538125 RepID=A0AAV4RW98_9ARAC|nr:hypothetical protein CDAR_539451 [Caerostris darwini]
MSLEGAGPLFISPCVVDTELWLCKRFASLDTTSLTSPAAFCELFAFASCHFIRFSMDCSNPGAESHAPKRPFATGGLWSEGAEPSVVRSRRRRDARTDEKQLSEFPANQWSPFRPEESGGPVTRLFGDCSTTSEEPSPGGTTLDNLYPGAILTISTQFMNSKL